MPQLTLEYTANILEKDQFTTLFSACHELLTHSLNTAIENCKSRAYEATHFFIGDGAQTHAFVHVRLEILAGRTTQVLQETGEQLLTLLTQHFAQTAKHHQLQISLEISELSKHYFKSSDQAPLSLVNTP